MKKYHVATGDGKGYYGVGYESYRQAESLLKISQAHDPQAHIVEEAFTNADRIRTMTDSELANFFADKCLMASYLHLTDARDNLTATEIEAQKHTMYGILMKWLKQPADGDGHGKT